MNSEAFQEFRSAEEFLDKLASYKVIGRVGKSWSLLSKDLFGDNRVRNDGLLRIEHVSEKLKPKVVLVN